ncbi:MAG: hypothetical protein RLZZ485_43, partial [Actinomycetota bacterium]
MKALKRIIVLLIVATIGTSSYLSEGAVPEHTFAGPTQGEVNTASSLFIITVDRTFNGNYQVDIIGGGLNESRTLPFGRDVTSQSFSITPTATGKVT